MKYKYVIAVAFVDNDLKNGTANLQYLLDYKVNAFDRFNNLVSAIKKNNPNWKSFVILNMMLLNDN